MRSMRRYVILAFASVAALAVSGIASANHISNTSSLPTWNVAPNALPGSGGGGSGGSGTLAAVALTVQTASVYAHPQDLTQGGKIANVRLDFDNDVVVNLAGIPSCTATFGSGTTIAQAWERCGPGADTAPEVNAYLSPPTAVSGTISTSPPSNFPGCNLVFKKSATQILLFARATSIPNGTANCGSPATNTGGNTTATLVGTLSSVSITDFKTRLNVPVPATIPLALDNFKSTVKRASVFRGRCVDNNKLLNLRGVFTYHNGTSSGQPPDTVNKTKACT
jgi:hypothetical protein